MSDPLVVAQGLLSLLGAYFKNPAPDPACEAAFLTVLQGVFGCARGEVVERAVAWASEVQLLATAEQEELFDVPELLQLPTPPDHKRVVFGHLSVIEGGAVRQPREPREESA